MSGTMYKKFGWFGIAVLFLGSLTSGVAISASEMTENDPTDVTLKLFEGEIIVEGEGEWLEEGEGEWPVEGEGEWLEEGEGEVPVEGEGEWYEGEGEPSPGYSGGLGTEADPYQIANKNDWQALTLREQDWDKHFILTADIDFGGGSIAPVGSYWTPFAGNFDGKGHALRNAIIYRPGNDQVGVFGVLTSGGEIFHLGVESVDSIGYGNVGGLVGSNYGGTILSCYTTGTVSGSYDWSEYSGGLVGDNYSGKISSCYTAVTVSGGGYVGGLVGRNDSNGTLESCYTTGGVSGFQSVGGVVGHNSGTVTACYAVGPNLGYQMEGENNQICGVAGSNNGTITASYWDMETTGQIGSAGGEGRTTAEMTYGYAENTYVGWDFETFWSADLTGLINNGYPYLRALVPADTWTNPESITSSTHPDGNCFYLADTFAAVWPGYYPGAGGYLWRVDAVADTAVTVTNSAYIADASLSYPDPEPGTWYLHLAALDGDNNLIDGSQLNYRFRVGNPVPLVHSTSHPASNPSTTNHDFVAEIYVTGSNSQDKDGKPKEVLPSCYSAYYYTVNDIPDTQPGPGDPESTGNIITVPALGLGEYWFHVVVKDAAGNTSAVAHYPFTIRQPLPPVVSSTSHPQQDMAYPSRDVALAWQDPDGQAEGYYYLLDTTPDTIPGTDGPGSTAQTASYEDQEPGTYYFHIRARWADGYVTDTAHFRVNVRTMAAPTITSSTHPNVCEVYQAVNVTLAWTNPDSMAVGYYWVWNQDWTTEPTTANTYTTSLTRNFLSVSAGSWWFHIRAVDADGHLSDTGRFRVNVKSSSAVGQPTASFSATPLTGNAPLTVQFTDESIVDADTIHEWLWDFGDGATSSEQHPQHTYYIGDSYTVSLTVKSTCHEDIQTTANYVVVDEPVLLYSGGSGTYSDPYQIATAADWFMLQARYMDWNKHFILMNDIDFEGAALTPVGRDWEMPFVGVFDGDNHVLRNGKIDLPDKNYVGVFGFLGSYGKIHAVGVENINVTGDGYVGALAGTNVGNITSCHASCVVTGTSSCAGGLVGNCSYGGTITSCYATGAVNGYDHVGGLSGSIDGTVTSCYATGTVNGYIYVGGLSGYINGTVTSCYATGTVNGEDYVGGLSGYGYGTITSCYAVGKVQGDWSVGGLVGVSDATITSCYWDKQTTGQTASAGGQGRTTDEMTYPYAANTYTDWDFTTFWAADTDYSMNNGYPYLLEYIPPVEGEGEWPAEGEGEVPVEGEGEWPMEGEGESVPPAPPLIITDGGEGPGGDFTTAAATVLLEGTTDASAFGVLVNDTSTGVSFDPLGQTWSSTVSLVPGQNIFYVEAWNGWGVSRATVIRITRIADTVYVAPEGDDDAGLGSSEFPWRTIERSMTAAGQIATVSNPVVIQLAAGDYAERVTFVPHTRLWGADVQNPSLTRIVPTRAQLPADTPYAVIAAEDTALRGLTVQLPLDALNGSVALFINQAAMDVSYVSLNGSFVSGAVGANILGSASSGTEIRDSVIGRCDYGVRAIESRAVILQNTFTDIRFDAVFVFEPETKATLTTLVLGDASRPGTTGLNVFRNIEGLFVRNLSPEIMLAQLCDWGVYTPGEISAKISGNVAYEPFLTNALSASTLAVSVVEEASGLPITNAIVTATPGEETTTANVSGIYTLTLSPGQYMVKASAEGYDETARLVDVHASAFSAVTLYLAGGSMIEGEGEVPAEGEGEILTEGEGEVPVEGEGEILTEGEGEVPVEGEGEVPAEGEILPEGEGEIPAEGEGEVVSEGEGEILPEGEGEVPTEGEGEDEPSGCCSSDTKDLNLQKWFKKTLGDWMLVGLSLAALMALASIRK